jgi:hypothetical protein
MVVHTYTNKDKYQAILDCIQGRMSTQKEINSSIQDKGFEVIDRHQIKRDFLNLMIEKRQITELNKLFKDKSKEKDFVLRWLANKIWKGKAKKYYFRTPKTEKLHSQLFKIIDNLKGNQEILKLLKEVCIDFQAIEVIAMANYKWWFDDEEIKKDLKKKGVECSEEEIQKKSKRQARTILKFSKKNRKIGIQLENIVKVDKNDFMRIGKNLVEFKKLNDFIGIVYKNMTPMMIYVTQGNKDNRDKVTKPLMQKVVQLFFRLELASQIKIQ